MSAAPWFCWVDLLIHRGIEVTFADGTCPSRCPHHQVSHCEALQGWSADAQLFASLGKWCMTMEIHGNTRFFSKNDVLDLAFCGIFSVWYGSLSTKVGHEMHIQEEMLLELWPRGPLYCAGTQVDYDDFLVALPERDHLNSFTKEVPLFLRYLKAWEWMKGKKGGFMECSLQVRQVLWYATVHAAGVSSVSFFVLVLFWDQEHRRHAQLWMCL